MKPTRDDIAYLKVMCGEDHDLVRSMYKKLDLIGKALVLIEVQIVIIIVVITSVVLL